MSEIDKVKERLAIKFMVRCEDCLHNEYLKNDCPHEDKDICMWQLELAGEVLKDPSIAIVADDQSLPEHSFNCVTPTELATIDAHRAFGYSKALQDMKNEGFGKVLKKE